MSERQKILSWYTPDHDFPEKPSDWYISVCVIGLAIAIASLFVNNLLFAIFAILSTGSIILHAAKKPEMIEVAISVQGIQIRHDFYPFSKLHSFWINHEKHKDEIILHSDRAVLPHLIIPIRDVNPEWVRAELRMHIPERAAHKNLIDRLQEYLGF